MQAYSTSCRTRLSGTCGTGMAEHNWHNGNTQCVVVYHTYQHAYSRPHLQHPRCPATVHLRYTNKSANDSSGEYIRTGHSSGQGSTTTTRTHITQFINQLLFKSSPPLLLSNYKLHCCTTLRTRPFAVFGYAHPFIWTDWHVGRQLPETLARSGHYEHPSVGKLPTPNISTRVS